MSSHPLVHRWTAFSSDPNGGNPAGVVFLTDWLADAEMLRIARDVGYSETVFLLPSPGSSGRAYDVRYFSPQAEVTFCGHATVAAGVLLGHTNGTGAYLFHTAAGEVPVNVDDRNGTLTATLTSVTPQIVPADHELTTKVLATFGWTLADLDPGFPPALAYAGAWHLILVADDRRNLAGLTYNFEALAQLMAPSELTTVAVLWPEHATLYHARNLFPPGGVIEDPATGAAAAAFGAYLREHDLVDVPTSITIVQGEDLGRRSVLEVAIPEGASGISVSGTGAPLEFTDL